MRSLRILLPVAALVILLGLASGCSGGDDESDAATTVTPDAPTESAAASREEVIDDGDAICAEIYAAVNGLDASSASPSIRASQRADLYEGMVERLRGLNSDDAALTDLFAAGRDLVAASEMASESASEGDAVATASYEEDVEEALSDFQAAAADFGFTDCAGDGTALFEPADGAGGATDGTTVDPQAPTDEGTTGEEPAEPDAPDTGGTAGGGQAPDGDAATPDDGGGGVPAGPDDGGGDSGATGGFSPG